MTLSILDSLIGVANGDELPDGVLAAARGQDAAEALKKIDPKKAGAKLREMMLARHPARAARILLGTGLAKALFDVEEAENVGDMGVKVGEDDVKLCDHLADAVKAARKLLDDDGEPEEVRIRVLLAAMLHDYAKADPRYISKHEEASARIADAALRRLGFPLKDRNAVERAILLHMGCCDEDGVDEFLKECETPTGNFWKECMYLKIADPLSKGFDEEAEWRKKIMKKVKDAAKETKAAEWVRGNCRFAQTAKSIRNIKVLISTMAQKVQAVYDAWTQDEDGMDEELGGGGLCQDVAEAVADVLNMNGVEAGTVSQQVGDQHVYCIVKVAEGVFEVDIPPSLYETGSGYSWRKIPGIKFDSRFFSISKISDDPSKFEELTQY